MQSTSSRILYAFSTIVAVVATFFFHEGAHWAAGELLGNDMRMTLNSAYPVTRQYLEPSHVLYVAAAGPLLTLVQAGLAYFALARFASAMIYPYLLTPAIMRILAGFMNIIRPQDEGRISQSLGLGVYTLPLLTAALLIALAMAASRRHGYGMRVQAWSIVLIIVVSSVVILTA